MNMNSFCILPCPDFLGPRTLANAANGGGKIHLFHTSGARMGPREESRTARRTSSRRLRALNCGIRPVRQASTIRLTVR